MLFVLKSTYTTVYYIYIYLYILFIYIIYITNYHYSIISYYLEIIILYTTIFSQFTCNFWVCFLEKDSHTRVFQLPSNIYSEAVFFLLAYEITVNFIMENYHAKTY